MARRESTEPLLPLPAIKTVPGVGRGNPGQVKTLESYLVQVEKCVELVQKKHSKKFNKEQCDYLAGKLQVVVESASLFLNGQCPKHQASCSCADMGRSVQIFELLLALAKQIESFVEGCCNEAWIQAAMKLTNTSEYVASLGFNLELCRVAFSKGSGAAENLTFSQVEVEGINKAVVDIVEQKALVDMDAVLAKLTSELRVWRGNKRAGVAAYGYLYQRLLRIRGDPDSFTSGPSTSGATDEGYLQNFCRLLKGKKTSEMKLGKGSYATVYKVNWQGTQVASKTFYGKEDPSFLQEAKILEGLCHPNIMSMYGFEMVTNSCSIYMELMDGDLHEFIRKRMQKRLTPFNILEAIDIILQVGEGVNYLHSKQIVHRDLKAANILYKIVFKNVEATEMKIGYVLAKVADFGLSKIKESTTSNLTLNTGTWRWMAPEIIDLVSGSHERPLMREKRTEHPFKCDVYSFGMVCYEILTGDVPFGDEKLPTVVKDKVKQGVRPTLPNNCPSILRVLIEKCWDKVPEQRPSLDIICLELKYLKYLLITGGTADMPIQLSSSTIVASEEAQQAFANEDILQALAIGTNEEPLPGGTEDSFGESEEQPAPESSTEEGESSDANFEGVPFDEFSEGKVQTGLEYLSSATKPKVLTGFAHLIKCASLPGGPLAVANAKFIRPPPDPPIKAIPKSLELAKTQDPQYSKLAMKLMVALTSDEGPGPDSEITLEVADGLDVLISLVKEGRLTRTRLLAAETVANILLNRQVRKSVRSYNGIVPALVALSNVDPGCVSSKDLKKADTVCSKGLQRLAKCSKRGDKTQMIVAALLRLLRKGLSYQPELTSLVKDSLVALENIVLEIDNATSANEVLKVIWKEMSELLMTEGFAAHTTVPGRMAIISIMTKLCDLYKENINKYLFLYLLKMMKGTRTEIENLLAPSASLPQEGNVEEQLKNLKKLLGRSVRLLCYCVTHGKETAQSVLSENVDERITLEEMVHGENSGILDESRLKIQCILDQIYLKITPTTVVERIAILVKLSKSIDQGCRQQIAGKLRTFVAGKQNLSEFKEAGGIGALMALLQDSNPNCQRDALIALQDLSLSVEIPVDQLPFQIILDFLDDKRPICERNAAIWLLDLIIKVPKGADMFVKTKGALEATLNLLKKGSDSPGSQKSATALLEMAKEDVSVRRRIAEPGLRGLGILVKYVRDHVKDSSRIEFKELLTATLVLFCGDGEAYQEAVIEADGHMFLLTSLEEKISKEKSAQGLLELIRNTGTREKILEAGFVTVAMGSIDARFACTDIALGLSLLSSTPEGLKQIYSDSRSVPALLNLVEHCREPKGQDAAASVIARLYPRLNREEDLARQTKIAERCELFFKYLNPLDMSHLKEFLEALAAIAADMKGRKWIHEYRGHQLLIDNLSVTQTDIQGLMLKVIAEMCSDVSENGAETRDAKRIRGAFMEHRIADKLFKLFESTEFLGRTENVKHALILIRNLSLAGPYVCEQLAVLGVVTLLLGVLKRHESPLSVVTELAVKALEKFLDDPRGKQVFIKGGGIKSLAAVLKLDAFGRTGDAKSFSTIILTSVAKDPQTRKYACETIFECDILSALNQIIFNGETSRIRWQAAVLMKLLAMYGPTKHVCSAMKAKGCLDALITLRNVQHCNEMANDVLKFVSEKSKDCKRYIDGRLAQLEN